MITRTHTHTHTHMHKHLQSTGRRTAHMFKKMQILTDVRRDKRMIFIEFEVLVSRMLTLLSFVLFYFSSVMIQ